MNKQNNETMELSAEELETVAGGGAWERCKAGAEIGGLLGGEPGALAGCFLNAAFGSDEAR